MTTPLHSMTPAELAQHGIPVEVALRARIEYEEWRVGAAERRQLHATAACRRSRAQAFQDALAIIEAKGTP